MKPEEHFIITAWGRLTDGNPVTTHMNAATRYVVSRTLEDRVKFRRLVPRKAPPRPARPASAIS